MRKQRLLIPISLQFSVRYLLRTGLLARLSASVQPVILLGWEDQELQRELERDGCEVHLLLKARWGANYERIRSCVNFWHQTEFRSPSTQIRERRANLDRSRYARLNRGIRRMARSAIIRVPGSVKRIRQLESELFLTDTNAARIEKQIEQLRVDAIFCLTPFLQDEEMTARVCSLGNIPSSAAILSFDNLTTRSWIPVTFGQYLLWNRHNAEQLRRGYPETAGSNVVVVGSPQFDFYWDRNYLWDEGDWRRQLSIPQGRPVILFGGGYFTCAPHEPQFLHHLDEAIERNEIPHETVILFRRHPVDPIERWEPVLKNAKHVISDDPWQLGKRILGHTNVRHDDIARLASTLYYSSVHVNVASTMTVDGAIFDRPQIGPAYDASASRKYDRAANECYLQEHYLPITQSGGLDMARDPRQLVEAVRSAFEEPARLNAGRKRIVDEICTFSDGKCTERVALELESHLLRSEGSSALADSSVAQ
jgi:hypothetical protein